MKNNNPFNNLSSLEYQSILKYPAYIFMLSISINDTPDEIKNKLPVKFIPSKTSSCNLLIAEFYSEAEKVFKNNIELLRKELPLEKKRREMVIKHKLLFLKRILMKLGKDFALMMHASLKSLKDRTFKEHLKLLDDIDLTLSLNNGQITEKLMTYTFLPDSQNKKFIEYIMPIVS